MRPVPFRIGAAALSLCAALISQESPPAGHSHQGDSFNEGPRQAAYLMPNMGNVVFEIQTGSERAQAFFSQGVAQLHGFWYFEAERSFRQVAALDPDCAMAYWGMAMANVENQARAFGLAHEAWTRRDNASRLGRMHIDALARFYGANKELKRDDKGQLPDYKKPDSKGDKRRRGTFIKALEEIVFEFPKDIETKALLVNQLWLDSRHGRPISSKAANQALLDQVFAANPWHPAHHYRIHLWDSNDTAKRVTDSAAKSGPSMPGVAHMWHMAGHIWAKLDQHVHAAWSQEASARVDHAHMMRDRVMPDQIHNFAHNNEWMTRSLRHSGQVSRAIEMAKNMVELPRHPKWNQLSGGRRGSAYYGRRNLLETLELFEEWQTLLDLSRTMYLEPDGEPIARARRLQSLAMAYGASGHPDELPAIAKKIEAIVAELTDPEPDTEADPCADSKDEGAKSKSEQNERDRKARKRSRDSVERTLKGVQGLIAFYDGDHDKAFEQMKDGRIEAFFRARLMLDTGRFEEAEKLARSSAKNPKGQAHPLANLAWVLHRCGKHEDAEATFETLRKHSATFELDAVPFARLAPLAQSMKLPKDWRTERKPWPESGQGLDLDDLGPCHWSPQPAPEFALPDWQRKEHRLADSRGKPRLVIFFLGFECVHCVEQLQAFAPRIDDFRAAGIEIVTIGNHSVRKLAQALEGAPAKDSYPFPVLADPRLETFKAYRAHDDFEGEALHGTFLIDEEGRVRWQDIGYEPFMDVDFALQESARLLALPVRN